MLVHQAYRYELDPNNATAAALRSHCGASRFAFNWGLSLVKERLELRHQIRAACYRELLDDKATEALVAKVALPWTLYSLVREWNRQKDEVAPWWKENSKFAYASGLEALATVLSNFSASKRGLRGALAGFPNKKKHFSRRSCRFWSVKLKDDRHVKLPRIDAIRTKEQMSELAAKIADGSARVLNAAISEVAGHWFVSFCCELDRNDESARLGKAMIGVDLGISHLAVLSDGTFVENPRAMNRYSKQMARLKKERSRRVRGSKRHRHTQQKIADTHRKVKNLRTDALHQLSAKLSQSYGTVVIEDLNVKGMSASAKGSGNWRGKAALNRAILDVAPAEFRRQLSYKLAWRGGNLIVADRYFPSSKTCSACGRVKAKLALSERRYRCECGLDLDRDLNAARNLASFGARVVAGGRSETENGRRGERLQDSVVAVWCSPVKRQAGTRELDRTGIVGTYAE